MANDEHLRILLQGVEAWNEWRTEKSGHLNLCGANLSRTNLEGVDLNGVDLSMANLSWANLSRANLSGAYLSRTNLMSANLSWANLCGANLSWASLVGANLFEANLYGANLREADLRLAYLGLADLRLANLNWANLCNANLRSANLREADFGWADLGLADLSGAELIKANLSGAGLIETNLERAILTGCRVYGVSAWNMKLNGADQNNLIITKIDEPTISVDNIEVAQFIYLILNHKKIREVIKSVTEKGVLILGRFGDGGLEVLHSIAAKLRELEYLPIIFDFDRPDNKNYTETIKILVGLSRFVIADLSGPSVPHELSAIVSHFKIPFILIIEEGKKPYSMHRDLLDNDWVLSPIIEFKNKDHLIEMIPSRIIEPAEEKCIERQDKLNQLFKS
jgi:uncharacterized protein YjbI with pentapeptide repeats